MESVTNQREFRLLKGPFFAKLDFNEICFRAWNFYGYGMDVVLINYFLDLQIPGLKEGFYKYLSNFKFCCKTPIGRETDKLLKHVKSWINDRFVSMDQRNCKIMT